MFFPEGNVRVYLHESGPVDMRKSFRGLYALVNHVLGEDPLSGDLFTFVNRKGSYVKILYFDRTGWCNENQLFVVCALANLFMARRHLLRMAPS